MHILARSLRRMSLLLGIALMSALFVGNSFAFAGGGETPSPYTISVNGTGKVSVSPDMAVISFTVQTTDTTAKLSQSANADIVHDIKIALTDSGSGTSNLKTTYFSTYPEYDYTYTEDSYVGEEYIKDYITYHTFDFKVYDLDQVGDLADLFVEHGANYINNISYAVENTDRAEVQARRKAFAQAKARAKELASLSDGTLGSVTWISEYTYVPYCCDYYGNYSISYDSAISEEVLETTVPEPGLIDIQVDVSITYELLYTTEEE